MSRVGRELWVDHLPSSRFFFPPFVMNTKSAVLVALAWHILRSSQRPHELYQSLEVAHRVVFGYGPSFLGMVVFTSNTKCLLSLNLYASLLAFQGHELG